MSIENLTPEEQEATRARLIDYAWETGKLTYKLHAGQKLIHKALKESADKQIVCNISRQWGKSFLCVTIAIEKAIQIPNARIYYATGTHKDLVQFIIPTFNKILEDCPYRFKPEHKYNNQWQFPNGSQIYLTGLDKHPDGPRGNTLDLIILDEAAFMDNLGYLVTSVFGPATLHRPNAKIIMISTPPKSSNHEFNDFILSAKTQGNYHCFTIHDNPLLSEEQIQQECKNQGGPLSPTWRREYLCELVSDETRMIIPEWLTWKDTCIKVPPKTQFYNYYHKYISLDIGTKVLTAGLFGFYSFEDSTLYIEDEFTLHDKNVHPANIANIINQMREQLWPHNQPFRGVCDHDKVLMNGLYADYKLLFNPVQKKSLIDMVAQVRSMVNNGHIVINPKCKMLLGCMEAGIWDAGSIKTQEFKKFATSKSLGHYDHLSALIYMVITVDRRTNPIPPLYGIDLSNKIMLDPDKYRNLHSVARAFTKAIKPKHKR